MSDLLYMQVADNIINRIHNKELKENEKLSERQLAAQYQVSRTVVRESIKLLNEKGLVYTVYGKGSYVKRPDDKLLMDKFQNAMDMGQVKQEDVLEARELVENAMISLLIERTDEKDIAIMEELQRKMEESIDDARTYIEYDAKFHLALSMCTHNRVLGIITGTLNRMAKREQFLSEKSEDRIKANQEHRNIIDALKDKNQENLCRAIKEHISCIRLHVEG